MNAYRFEKGKHDEYKQAYYAKGDELETCQTMLGMAKFDKKQAERKATESNNQVTELQEKYASLSEQMAKLEKESSQLAREFTVKSQSLAKANDTINKVHDLLNSGAKGQETMAALIETGEYRKKV